MLLNILHHKLEPQVSCNVIATETQEPSNLISGDPKLKSLGFLAYSCVKPPVDLTFIFKCKINLEYLIIWPSVGSQKSTGFEILIKSEKDYVTFGYGYLKSELGIVFYRGDKYSKYSIEELNFPKDFLKLPLHCKEKSVISNATSVRIKIIKTSSSIPAIGKIEIWGTVSNNSPKEIKHDIQNIWMKEINAVEVKNEPLKINEINSEKPTLSINNESVQSSNDVPEEFLDLITYEIMALPLVLPSGKVIDESTLEKHNKTEATWGRPPSDPFTGQPFNENRKPFLSFALKNKIDKFLLENCNAKDFMNIPRTVGRLQKTYSYTKPIINHLTSSGSSDKQDKPSSDTKVTELSAIKLSNTISKYNSMSENKAVKRTVNEPSYGINKYLKLAMDSLVRVPTQKRKSELKIDNNKSYTYQRKTNPSLVNLCSVCTKSENLFKITCTHLICRACLLVPSVMILNCKICGQDYERKNVERFHNV